MFNDQFSIFQGTNILNFQFSINQLKKENMDKKSIWKLVIQTLVTILTAIGTTLGVTSCL